MRLQTFLLGICLEGNTRWGIAGNTDIDHEHRLLSAICRFQRFEYSNYRPSDRPHLEPIRTLFEMALAEFGNHI